MLLSTAFAPISKLSTGKCPLIHRTYPQKKGEHPAYPQEKMTRFEQAASLPGKVRPRISQRTHTHERKQKNKTNKNKTNKTKTKRQNNKTKINNKNRKQNKKMIMSKNN